MIPQKQSNKQLHQSTPDVAAENPSFNIKEELKKYLQQCKNFWDKSNNFTYKHTIAYVEAVDKANQLLELLSEKHYSTKGIATMIVVSHIHLTRLLPHDNSNQWLAAKEKLNLLINESRAYYGA